MTSSFLAVAKKIERKSEGFGLWKKLTWKGPEVGGGAQAPWPWTRLSPLTIALSGMDEGLWPP